MLIISQWSHMMTALFTFYLMVNHYKIFIGESLFTHQIDLKLFVVFVVLDALINIMRVFYNLQRYGSEILATVQPG